MRSALVESTLRIFFLTLCLVLWGLVPALAQEDRGPVQPRPGLSPVVGSNSPDFHPPSPVSGPPGSGGRTADVGIPDIGEGFVGVDKGIDAYLQIGGDDVLMYSDPDRTFSGLRSTAFDSEGNG